MNTPPEQEYVLGTDEAELVRLGFQHRVWSEYAFALWERAGFTRGQTILDVGCGPGYASFDLSQWVGPNGRVVAIDASARFIEYFKKQQELRGVRNIETRVGDVRKLDVPAESVDGAYARWVLCFVDDPESVVAGVAKALRRGAAFAVQDYFNYRSLSLAPRSPALTKVVEAVAESMRLHGGDDDFAGRLPAMMARHGLEVREIRPILRVARPTSILWHWPTTFFSTYVPKLVSMGLLTADDQGNFEKEWSEASQNPHTFFSTPPVFEVIGVKR